MDYPIFSILLTPHFVCASEFAALTEQYEEFERLGAEVVTFSTDTNNVHLAWQRNENMLGKAIYPMGSDRTGSLSRIFCVYDEESEDALRGAFIIDPEGTLFNTNVNFYNLGRNGEESTRKVKANIHLEANPVEVSPDKWKKEGDKTLKPSAKTVSKFYETLK